MPLPYRLLYAIGITPWEVLRVPPALVDLVEGEAALPPGRALDLGCGTGMSSIYLADHGWEVTGVDMVPRALAVAKERGRHLDQPPRWVCGDVTRLNELNLGGGYTLVLDIGCLFSLRAADRFRVLAELAVATLPGGRLLRFGMTDREDILHNSAGEWRPLWYRHERKARIPLKNASPSWCCLERCQEDL